MNSKLLLLSNSTNYGSGFLDHAMDTLQEFLFPGNAEVLFIPYAAVDFTYEEYAQKVQDRFKTSDIQVVSIHKKEDPAKAIQEARAIAVGGGNTFHLLKELYDKDLLNNLRDKVRDGIPYVGWSAGSNVACPTIQTTNDMPVVEPPSFKALNLLPYQINPHYTEKLIPEHGGESREKRLIEYVHANPRSKVIALPEGSWLETRNQRIHYFGDKNGKVISKRSQKFISHGDILKL